MDQAIKEQWTRALRSGDFLQGKGQLARVAPEGTQYCCLGVLCELSPVEVETISCPCKGDCEAPADFRWDNSLNYLPDSVAEWSGLQQDEFANVGDVSIKLSLEDVKALTEKLKTNSFLLISNPNRTTLSKLNDAGLDFAGVADIIERYL